MKIEICDSYEAVSLRAKDIILNQLKDNKNLLFCAATGGSPTRMYELLAEEYNNTPSLFSQLRVIKLDEWGGLSMDNKATCESYLLQHLLKPLNISSDRYISLNSNPSDPEKECQRVAKILEEQGPIDICILGIGLNGHIALNEPAEYLQANCHVAYLAQESLQHPMLSADNEKPEYGLTLGVADIMQSKLVILLINGVKKREITKELLTKKIMTQLPASLLWLHPHVICLIDRQAVEN